MKKIILLLSLFCCTSLFAQNGLVVQNNTNKGTYITAMVTKLQNPNNIGSNVFVGYVSRYIQPNSTITLQGILSDPTARWFIARLYAPSTREYAISYFDSYQSPRNVFVGLHPNWVSNTLLVIN